ncbi:MAG: amidohydrolase family protein [Planctomycetes bacterium]|nr:amidohydrolase family protein [Planctomycetota bacterium]
MSQTIFKAGTILAGRDFREISGGAVLVEDGRIREIYESLDGVVFPRDAAVVDLGDLTLMPGMIDCHNHLALDARLENHLVKMNDAESEQTLRAVVTMRDDLLSGVTTARCLGDRFYIDVVCRNAQRQGRLFGPRLVVSGIGMRSKHGHGFVGMPHCGAEDFRCTARENILRGVDFLKLYMTKVINDKPFIYHFLTPAELAAVVEEARSVNIPTACHCSGGQGLDDCLDAGISCLEHVYYISEPQVERVKATDTWVVYTPSYFLDDTLLFKFSPLDRDGSLRERDIITGCIRNAIRAGLKFGIGTDALHTGLAGEACHIAALGAANKDVLAGITTNAADLCGIGDTVGALAAGYAADLVAVAGNPLRDIDSLRRVGAVVQAGRVVRCDADPALVATGEKEQSN